MTDSNSAKIEALRSKAQTFVKQAANDPDLGARLREDPISTLEKAGFQPGSAAQLARELASQPDVSGNFLCDWVSCIVTWCADWGVTNIPDQVNCGRSVIIA